MITLRERYDEAISLLEECLEMIEDYNIVMVNNPTKRERIITLLDKIHKLLDRDLFGELKEEIF